MNIRKNKILNVTCPSKTLFLTFSKMFLINCEHCKNNIKCPEAFEVLKKYSVNECTLLKPVLIQDSRSL